MARADAGQAIGKGGLDIVYVYLGRFGLLREGVRLGVVPSATERDVHAMWRIRER
ncbi:MAG: hypothetical protein KA385_18700 [Vicinamibacteria bacterium]|nr:hypothetical protein [Vicinamibacteria bacterium]